MPAPVIGSTVFVAVPAPNNALPALDPSGVGFAPATVVANLGTSAYTVDGGGTAYQTEVLAAVPQPGGLPPVTQVLGNVLVYPTRATAWHAAGAPTTAQLVAASAT